MAKKGREEMISMGSRFEDVFSFMGKRKGMKTERLLFNAELLDQKREDVFAVMYLMGVYR
ncbi:hypothetical protein ACW0JT_07705 [Arthrobacter sp. SA17]